MINLEPLKSDIMKLERYYGDLKHYLDNFGEYVRLGKNNMTYEQAVAEINLVAKRHKDFVEAYHVGLKENEILALETKLEKYKMIKLGMMQNLLTGKIRLV